MTSRERVLGAMNLQEPDRPPRLLYGEVIGYVPAIRKMLEARCAPLTPCEYFKMDLSDVLFNATRLSVQRFTDWLPDEALQEQAAYESTGDDSLLGPPLDEWGVWRRSTGTAHLVHVESPLATESDFGRIREYPWPDLDQAYRADGLADRVRALHEKGLAVAGFAGSIFEQAWYIRGMETLMTDMLLRPEVAHFMLDRTAHFQRLCAIALAEAGVDLVLLGDDVASQQGLMMSVKTWRAFLKERLAATTAAVKKARAETKVVYHSDGNVQALIPDLIEAGVNVLNPVQPECMDPEEIKREFGKDLCFFGSVSVQQTMPFGSPDDVRAEVWERIRTLGQGGGLILSPAHVLPMETPWENIEAFFEAAGM